MISQHTLDAAARVTAFAAARRIVLVGLRPRVERESLDDAETPGDDEPARDGPR